MLYKYYPTLIISSVVSEASMNDVLDFSYSPVGVKFTDETPKNVIILT